MDPVHPSVSTVPEVRGVAACEGIHLDHGARVLAIELPFDVARQLITLGAIQLMPLWIRDVIVGGETPLIDARYDAKSLGLKAIELLARKVVVGFKS